MATVPNHQTVTYEEWLRMPEVSDAIEEVVNGEIRMVPPPKWIHTQIIRNLRRGMEAQVDERSVTVLVEQFGLVVQRSPLIVRVPDLAIFENASIVEQDGYIHSAPQLAIDVVSPSNTPSMLEEKLADYASLGVREVWVFRPGTKTVAVFHLQDGQLRCVQSVSEGVLSPKHFSSVQVDIAAIWPEQSI